MSFFSPVKRHLQGCNTPQSSRSLSTVAHSPIWQQTASRRFSGRLKSAWNDELVQHQSLQGYTRLNAAAFHAHIGQWKAPKGSQGTESNQQISGSCHATILPQLLASHGKKLLPQNQAPQMKSRCLCHLPRWGEPGGFPKGSNSVSHIRFFWDIWDK